MCRQFYFTTGLMPTFVLWLFVIEINDDNLKLDLFNYNVLKCSQQPLRLNPTLSFVNVSDVHLHLTIYYYFLPYNNMTMM